MRGRAEIHRQRRRGFRVGRLQGQRVLVAGVGQISRREAHVFQLDRRHLIQPRSDQRCRAVSGMEVQRIQMCRLRIGLDRDLVRRLQTPLAHQQAGIAGGGIGHRDFYFQFVRLHHLEVGLGLLAGGIAQLDFRHACGAIAVQAHLVIASYDQRVRVCLLQPPGCRVRHVQIE